MTSTAYGRRLAADVFDCAGLSIPACAVGGDFYDFIDLPDGRLAVILADISGKGIAAAVLATRLRTLLKAECATPDLDPLESLRRVNQQFFLSTAPEQYATLFFGVYDAGSGRLSYVNCGQQPAFVVRRNGLEDRLETTALPVGMLSGWFGEERIAEMRSGDTLCVCSDGVVEAGITTGEEFGEARLLSLLREGRQSGVSESVQRVASAAKLFVTSGPGDDLTVMQMRAV